MAVPKIQTVCGYGCGSSLMLRMNVEKIAKANGYEVEAFCGDVGTCCGNDCDVIDVGTCCGNDCDVIFISKELGERIEGRAKVPVVEFDNFMNKAEVEEKTLAYLESFGK